MMIEAARPGFRALAPTFSTPVQTNKQITLTTPVPDRYSRWKATTRAPGLKIVIVPREGHPNELLPSVGGTPRQAARAAFKDVSITTFRTSNHESSSVRQSIRESAMYRFHCDGWSLRADPPTSLTTHTGRTANCRYSRLISKPITIASHILKSEDRNGLLHITKAFSPAFLVRVRDNEIGAFCHRGGPARWETP